MGGWFCTHCGDARYACNCGPDPRDAEIVRLRAELEKWRNKALVEECAKNMVQHTHDEFVAACRRADAAEFALSDLRAELAHEKVEHEGSQELHDRSGRMIDEALGDYPRKRDGWLFQNYAATIVAMRAELEAAKQRAEQAEVQLAGCGVAALGGIAPRTEEAKPGDYGWSASYGDVVKIRRELDAARRDLEDASQFSVGPWTLYIAISGKWVASNDDGCTRHYFDTRDEALRRARALAKGETK